MQENPYAGIFIALEGIDGSGKTEQAWRTVKHLQSRGFSVFYTKEPSYRDNQQRLRSALAGEQRLTPKELQQMFSKDRELHLAFDIIPRLGLHMFVITDRYFLSTIAYGMAKGVSFEWLFEQACHKIENFILPDLTIILDTSAKTAIERLVMAQDQILPHLKKDKEKRLDIFEKESVLAKIRKNYHMLAKRFERENVYLLDGDRNPDAVFNDIKVLVDNLLTKRGFG